MHVTGVNCMYGHHSVRPSRPPAAELDRGEERRVKELRMHV